MRILLLREEAGADHALVLRPPGHHVVVVDLSLLLSSREGSCSLLKVRQLLQRSRFLPSRAPLGDASKFEYWVLRWLGPLPTHD